MPERMDVVDLYASDTCGEVRHEAFGADGTSGDVDFSAREWGGVLEPLRDPAYAAQVRVDPESGTIACPSRLIGPRSPFRGGSSSRHRARAEAMHEVVSRPGC